MSEQTIIKPLIIFFALCSVQVLCEDARWVWKSFVVVVLAFQQLQKILIWRWNVSAEVCRTLFWKCSCVIQTYYFENEDDLSQVSVTNSLFVARQFTKIHLWPLSSKWNRLALSLLSLLTHQVCLNLTQISLEQHLPCLLFIPILHFFNQMLIKDNAINLILMLWSY